MTKLRKKLTVPTLAPRNPFVAAAKQRHAGSHRKTQKTERQRASRQIREQLAKNKTPVDDGGFYFYNNLLTNGYFSTVIPARG